MPGLGTEAPKVARAWLAANMPEAVVTKELVTEVVKTLSEELSGEEHGVPWKKFLAALTAEA